MGTCIHYTPVFNRIFVSILIRTLVSVALISVPWMLLPKPAILYFYNWRTENQKAVLVAGAGLDMLDDEDEVIFIPT